jgi:hypothetical protein
MNTTVPRAEMRRIRQDTKRRLDAWRRSIRAGLRGPSGELPILIIPMLPETVIRLAQERAVARGVLTNETVSTIH